MSNGFGPIVAVEWLAGHIDHSPLRPVDCRWYLTDPGGGRRAYDRGHIPGARYMSIDDELTAESGPGRHPLPPPDEIAARLGAAGIGNRNFVVAYDDAGGSIAARLWWMLRSIGHQRVGVLDGGIQAWVATGGELSTAVPEWPAAELTVEASAPVITRDEIRRRLGALTLVDARAAERYRGEVEPIDPAAGHIPTAMSLPADGNIGPDGRFLDPDALRDRYRDAGIESAEGTVVYCGSGVTACHDILAMEAAGLGTATLYAGSWSDWSSSGEAVATGADPGGVPA